MKNILVIGGAGYIGSHMCKSLAKAGYRPIVLDSLVCGHRGAVKWGPLIEGDLADRELLRRVFSEYSIGAVMHFAAFIDVGESVENPAIYYQNNVAATISLLHAMVEAKVRRFILSSSAAVYGDPMETPVSEAHPLHPISPYGRSKRMVEQILEDFQAAYGMNYVSLRYFNAAGADPKGEIGEDHRPESHLIPLVLQAALGKRKDIKIYGNDYPTKDGTCIRDYIHICDLAQAHLLAVEQLLDGASGGIYNLGNGDGYSVKEVIDIARKISGRAITTEVIARRPGDAAVLVGSSEKAARELAWKPRYSELALIVEHAWNWHRNHPQGFAE